MMEDEKEASSTSLTENSKDLSDEEANRSIIVANLPAKTTSLEVTIHFQKEKNFGGDIETVFMLNEEKAVVVFYEHEVAEKVLKKEQEFQGVILDLKPYIKKNTTAFEKEVFSLVSAKINPALFNLTPDKIKNLLASISIDINISFIELCDGFWVSGTYSQIQKTCEKLSSFATPDRARYTSPSSEQQNGMREDEQECKPFVAEVQSELIYILRKSLKQIENDYNIKIEHDTSSGIATLSPLGDKESFQKGTDEFIELYQKSYPLMEKKTLEQVTDEAAFKQLRKELMGSLNVVIQRREKQVSVYGRSEDVSEAMRKLQGKQRRGRKPVITDSAKEDLPRPDITAQVQMPATLTHALDNGITIAVYQGDLTKQHVDAIVNAANERLEHIGGLAGAVVKQGGYQIQLESTQIVQRCGVVPVGQVAYTASGNLPCKMILHAVGPRWSEQGPERSRQFIHQACFNSLMKAENLRLRSIAIPAISSGIFGVPVEICAEMLFAAAEMFSCEVTSNNQLKDIRFVNIDAPTNEAIRREFYKRYVHKQEAYDSQPRKGTNSGDNWDQKATDRSSGRTPSNSGSRQERPAAIYATVAATKGNKKATIERKDDKISSSTKTRDEKQSNTLEKAEQEAKLTLASKSSEGASPSFGDGFKQRQMDTNRSNDIKGATIKPKGVNGISDTGNVFKFAGKGRGALNFAPSFPHPGKTQLESFEKREIQKPGHVSNEELKNALDAAMSAHEDVKTTTSKPNRPRSETAMKQQTQTEEDKTTFSKWPGQEPKAKDPKSKTMQQAQTTEQSSEERDTQEQQSKDLQTTEKASEDHKQSEVNLDLSNLGALPNQQPYKDSSGDKWTQSIFEENANSLQTEQYSQQQPDEAAVPDDPARATDQQQLDLSPSQSSTSPPGLHITKEGVDLADLVAEYNLDSPSSAENFKKLLPTLPKDSQDAKFIKRKMIDLGDSLYKSPKQRKEDSTMSDEDKTVDEDNTLQSQDDKAVIDDGEENSTSAKSEREMHTTSDDEYKGGNKSIDSTDSNREIQEGDYTSSESATKQACSGLNTDARIDEPTTPERTDQSSNLQDNDSKHSEAYINGHLSNSAKQANDMKNVSKLNESGDINPVEGDKSYVAKNAGKEKRIPKTPPKHAKTYQTEFEAHEKTLAAHDSNLNNSDETCVSISSFEVVDRPKEEDDNEKLLRSKRVSEGSSSSESIVIIDPPPIDDHKMTDDTEIKKTNQNGTKIGDDGKDNEVHIPSSKNVVSGGESENNSENDQVHVDAKDKKLNISNVNYSSRNGNDMAADDKSTETDRQSDVSQKDNYKTDMPSQPGNSDGNNSTTTAARYRTINADGFPHVGREGIEETLQEGNEKKEVALSDDQLVGGFSLVIEADKKRSDENCAKFSNSGAFHQDDCRLCNTAFSNAIPKIILSGCGHVICQDCQIKHQHLKPFICPTCEKAVGCNELQPPGGKIKFAKLEKSLGGFEEHGTITVDYEIPAGVQGSHHPNPGQPYHAVEKRTFLPDTSKGKEVQKLLKKVFDMGEMFTIKENTIQFTEWVEHKSNLTGGKSSNGYPDPDYLERVTKQLKDILRTKISPQTTQNTPQE